jgi:hypothetical protein
VIEQPVAEQPRSQETRQNASPLLHEMPPPEELPPVQEPRPSSSMIDVAVRLDEIGRMD